jgi:hypothetical protein|tara:strand:+ start:99 stop:764 length:666 start_codon:yes stop_codon:yes gene_type:complete
MSFIKNKYQVIKEVISKDVAKVGYNYLRMREAAERKLQEYHITTDWHGFFNDPQVPGAYSIYGDYLMETLLIETLPFIEKKTSTQLVPTYAYTRLYKTGNILERHKDRFSCEISSTMNLGGDDWPIFISPKKNIGLPESQGGRRGITMASNAKGIKVILRPGDMLLYRGVELEHWREPFKGKECGQVFFHYNDKKGPYKTSNLYDNRTMLGLPSRFRNFKL